MVLLPGLEPGTCRLGNGHSNPVELQKRNRRIRSRTFPDRPGVCYGPAYKTGPRGYVYVVCLKRVALSLFVDLVVFETTTPVLKVRYSKPI